MMQSHNVYTEILYEFVAPKNCFRRNRKSVEMREAERERDSFILIKRVKRNVQKVKKERTQPKNKTDDYNKNVYLGSRKSNQI